MEQGIVVKGKADLQQILTALIMQNQQLLQTNLNIERINKTLSRNTARHRQATGAAKGHSSAMKGLALRFVGYNLAMNAVIGAQQKLLSLVGDSVTKYREFETRLAEISTILQEDVAQMDRFKSGIETLSVTYGQATSDISKGLYDILSAAFSARDAMNLLNTSIKASIAGLSDVRTSVKIFTTVLNSYGKSAEQATHVSDVLFQSVVRGKFQFENLEQALGYVVPIAAQAGIAFDELSAALSTATRHGLHIDMTARGLALAIQGIVNPSEKARKAAREYGVEMNGLALRVLGLKGWFDQLGDAMDKHGKSILGELVPNMRSLRVAMVLAGEEGALGFAEDLKYLEDVSGRTEEALQKMMDTSAVAAAKLEQEMEIKMRGIGDAWDEVVLSIKEGGIWIADNWQYLFTGAGKLLKIFDDLKDSAKFAEMEAIIKRFPETDDAIQQVENYIKAIKEQEALSIEMSAMDVNSEDYKNAYEQLKLYDSIIAATVDSYNDYVGAIKETQDKLGQFEINLNETELAIIDLDEALNNTVKVGWGNLQKSISGTLGLELAQLEAAQDLKDSQHDVKMGLISSSYGWKTNNTALQEAVKIVREHEAAQKADAQATKLMGVEMRLLQIQMLEIQLAGMMRRRGLTRAEEKKMKRIQIEQAKLRLENMKATHKETTEMHTDYNEKKQFIKEFLAELEEESYQLSYKYDDNITELETFIEQEKLALETRKEWWEITTNAIFDTSAQLIKDLSALPEPIKAFMKEEGEDVDVMLESARERRYESGISKGKYSMEGRISPVAALVAAKSPDMFSRLHDIGLPGFKRGIEYVPETMPAIIHRGERISAAGRDAGNGGTNIQQVVINVREIADIDSVEKMAAALGAVKQAGLTDRMGRSKYRL